MALAIVTGTKTPIFYGLRHDVVITSFHHQNVQTLTLAEVATLFATKVAIC